jgi:gas vesicle protein
MSNFLIGIIIGGIVGVVATCLCVAAGKGGDDV